MIRCFVSLSKGELYYRAYGEGVKVDGLVSSVWVVVVGGIGACLLFGFNLFRIRYVRCLMAFRCLFVMRFLTMDFGITILLSLWIECSHTAPLTSAVMDCTIIFMASLHGQTPSIFLGNYSLSHQ